MSARSGIIAGGNWIIDRLKIVDIYPEQDALANIIRSRSATEAVPSTFWSISPSWGASFPLAGIGLIGNDDNGKWILEQCRQNRIDTAGLQIHPVASTSYTDVMTVQATGRRTFFHQRGANAFLDEEHFGFRQNTAKLFHLGYLLLLDRMDRPDPEFGTVAARTLFRATEAGYKTSIDVVSEDSDRFAQVVLPALPHVDYCILNEFELGRTTGMEIRGSAGLNLKSLRAAAQQLLDAGVREWIIIHFRKGPAHSAGMENSVRREVCRCRRKPWSARSGR